MSFKRLQPEDIVISTDSVAGTIWSGNIPTLDQFFTSSIQTAGQVGQFYNSVFDKTPSSINSEVQFDIAYCNRFGSGSKWYNDLTPGYSPTLTNYGQYLTLILADENSVFTFGNKTQNYFYALNLQRARYKQSILPGSLFLKLEGPNGNLIELTDDSQTGNLVQFTDAGRVYQIVKATSPGVVDTSLQANGWTQNEGSYGLLLPDVNILLLNGAALDADAVEGGIELGTGRTEDTNNNNPTKLRNALEAGNGFTINNEEVLSSDFIFVRARNNEFNYSENPSFISGSTGELVQSSFVDNPQTYITTVGMYNDSNELLAVAKLSRPLPKDFTKEMLVRVKLDF